MQEVFLSYAFKISYTFFTTSAHSIQLSAFFHKGELDKMHSRIECRLRSWGGEKLVVDTGHLK